MAHKPGRRYAVGAIAMVVVLAVGGCGAPAEIRQGAASTARATSEAPATPAGEAMYSCFGPAYAGSVWASHRPARQARQHPGWRTLVKELGGEGPDGWWLLEQTEDRLAIARERDVALEPGDDMLRTHDFVSVAKFESEDQWMLEQWSSCTPELVVDGVGPAEVWLDDDPDAADTSLDLLVVESSCASGDSAEGRVRAVRVDEHDDRVEVVIGVLPRGGDQACPGNPATPFRLDLKEPIRDRQVIDASIYPARPMQSPPDGL